MSAVTSSWTRPLAGLLLLALALTSGRTAGAEPGSEATITARVKVNSLEVSLVVGDGGPGRSPLLVEAFVRNRGDTPLRQLNVTLHLPESSCVRLLGPESHHRGRLRGGDEAAIRWRLAATRGAETCDGVVILASAAAVDSDGDEISSESEAEVVAPDRF